MAKFDLHQVITDRIVAAIETTGTLPWVKPWTASGAGPRNGATGRRYTGVNNLLLSISAYTSNEWFTANNAAKLGGKVRESEKRNGTQIIYWKINKGKDEKGKEKSFPVLRYFVVYNRDQIDGLPPVPELPVREFNANAEAETFIMNTGANIQHGGSAAFYNLKTDAIILPKQEDFTDSANYYATALHEIIHWTGHKGRLDRLKLAKFGSPEYAQEELVAELGAAFLCAEIGIDGQTQHPEYIASWLKALKNDKRYIFTASKAATTAVEFLKGVGADAVGAEEE
jgi:antirestriction protein ArdC